jgi:flagellar biosynthetic protein FliR
MTYTLAEFLSINVFAWMLVFARVGTAFITLPGMGESFVTPRARLMVALLVSALLTAPLKPLLPEMPTGGAAMLALLFGEVFYGAFLGLLARLVMVTTEVAGMIIAMQLSLANASVFNPAMAGQSSLVSALLGLMAVTLMLATDMHHLLFMSIAGSYDIFVPGQMPIFGDFATAYSQMLGQSFLVATQLSAPFLLMGLVFYLGLGLLARLMPQLQIFFIAIPAQIYLGFILLSLIISTMMLLWLQYMQSTFQSLPGL